MRARIDRRYSEERAEAVPWADAEERLGAAEVAWIVTVRPDGRPHATAMVPVADVGRVYFHAGSTEVKYANIEANARVLVLAGDTGWDHRLDVAVEGTAVPVTDEAVLLRVAERYRGRWQLEDPRRRRRADPDRAYGHAKGEPFGQTTYRKGEAS
ncbi:pyridoxamine 5'-phosphate oxidase family protein [Asanoa sp. NPDC050611]|uniref:pyridoxamine 5'-phosphate oxidase family protein n=1 Tax=Asanoa sp. NPDC050611 TaxID=3157098 RepID=UPI0033C7CC43